MKVQAAIPPKLIPIFAGIADVRGSYGGRGSGKTRSFALMSAVRAHMWAQAGREGIILCGRQFMNSLDESSLEEVKAAISNTEWLAPHFEIGEKYIKTICGKVSYKFSGLDRNIDSIKSKSRILLCWVDEAEPVTDVAWVKLIPTLREADSELWVTWNPESKRSATHKRFRDSSDNRYKVCELNWRDNPRFPETLERQRLRDLIERPDQYDHIWEGGFATSIEGAYFAHHLAMARQENRITKLALDPLLHIVAYWDLGVRDATSIWVTQRIGQQIYCIDYYEAVGQDLAAHLNWLRDNGYGRAECVLPHDGAIRDNVSAISFEDHIYRAGFDVRTVKNQGKGAAIKRIEAARRLFGRISFDNEKTADGLEALGAYHEKIDEKRGARLGPEHDWSSHGADAFGLLCIDYEDEQYAVDDEYEREQHGRSSATGY